MNKPGKMIKQVLRSAFQKADTVRYPVERIEMPEHFRGRLQFHAEKCIGCKMCMRDCPSNAIQILKIGDKRFECRVDCSRCIYCAQCVDSCPKAALEATKEFELADLSRARLEVVFHAAPAKEPEPKV